MTDESVAVAKTDDNRTIVGWGTIMPRGVMGVGGALLLFGAVA